MHSLPDELIILLTSIGAIQSLFLSVYVFTLKEHRHHPNMLLGLLFLALAIRVTKSVLWAFWESTPLWSINLGFAAHATVGPLLLLYIYQYSNPQKRFYYLNYLHFIPFAAIMGLSFQLKLNDFWYQGGYSALLYHHLIYMIGCLILLGHFYRQVKAEQLEIYKSDVTWLRNLWIGVTVWGLAYFSNYILGWTSYLLGPILYSVIIYLLSFYGLKHQRIFQKREPEEKYKNLNLSSEEIERNKNKILNLMEEEKVYLDPDFTLTKMSELTSIPSHILSHIINDELGQNFSEFINSYRIEEASKKLKDPRFDHHKISSIAYDCGFNSLSSFNSAFKKFNDMTPSKYRDKAPSK